MAGDRSDDELDADVGHEGDAARWLKKNISRPFCQGSLQEVRDYLGNLGSLQAAAAVKAGNRNGKAALHFVSQFRGSDDDGIELMKLLISLEADVNASTRRGHTPLIFAAGRGHNAAVNLLLDHGASPCVLTVVGDTAAKNGRSRLDHKTQARLEAAADVVPPAAWRDFRESADAQAAQADHTKTCPHCQKKLREAAAPQLAEQARALQDTMTTAVSAALQSALREHACTELMAVATRSSQESMKQRQLFHSTLQACLRKLIDVQGPDMFIEFAGACQEHSLAQISQEKGLRDRRPLRSVLGAMVDTVRSMAASESSPLSLAGMVRQAEPYLALELFISRSDWQASDRPHVEALWERLAQGMARPESDSWRPDLLTVACTALSKRQGGVVVSEWLHFLRLAGCAHGITPVWADIVSVVAKQAVAKRLDRQLSNAVEAGAADLPQAVAVALTASIAESKKAIATSIRATRAPSARVAGEKLPLYALRVSPEWVHGDVEIGAVHEELRALSAGRASGERLLIGVDTEWGCEDGSDDATLAVLQIAAEERVWVVDCMQPGGPLAALVRWLVECPHALVIGFSFAHDADKLAALILEAPPVAPQHPSFDAKAVLAKVLDVQDLAMQVAPYAQTPGLKTVAEDWLGFTLDKTLQCSEWCRRPLTSAQISYAAADALVLLDIVAAMDTEHFEVPTCTGA